MHMGIGGAAVDLCGVVGVHRCELRQRAIAAAAIAPTVSATLAATLATGAAAIAPSFLTRGVTATSLAFPVAAAAAARRPTTSTSATCWSW